jgi:hypothetical protein
MLHGEQDRVDHGLEVVFVLNKEAAGAVLDYIHDKSEVTLTELRVSSRVLLDHAEGTLAKGKHDSRQKVCHQVTRMLHQD